MNSAVPFRDVCWLIALALVWGSSFAAIKVAVETVPPMTLVAARVVIAAGVLYAVALARGVQLPRDRLSWIMGFALATFGLALPFFLIGLGQTRIDSGLAAILMSVMPLATMVLAHFFTEGDPFTRHKLFGIVIGFAGIIVLFGPEALRGMGSDFWYQLAVAGGAVCYAINAVLTRNLPQGSGSSMIGRAVMVMISGVVIAVPAALLIDGPMALMQASTMGWWMVIYIGVLPTGLAGLVYFYLIETRGASFFSFVNYLNPVFGVIWGAVLLGEAVGLQALGALTLILAGVAVSSRRAPNNPDMTR